MEDVETVMNIIGTAVSTLAILLGGMFAYFKFIRGRVLCPNLALELTAVPHTIGGHPALALGVRIENSGTVALSLPLEGRQDLVISPIAAAVWDPGRLMYVHSKDLPQPLPPIRVTMTDGVIDADMYLEPGEVYDNALLVQIAHGDDWEAMQLLLTVEVRTRTFRSQLMERWNVDRYVGTDLSFTLCKVVTKTGGGSTRAREKHL